jgi:hypothetical protein
MVWVCENGIQVGYHHVVNLAVDIAIKLCTDEYPSCVLQ